MRQEILESLYQRRDQIKESLLNEVADPLRTPFKPLRGYQYPLYYPATGDEGREIHEHDPEGWYKPYPQSFPAVRPGFRPGEGGYTPGGREKPGRGRPGGGGFTNPYGPGFRPDGRPLGQDGNPNTTQP